MKFTPAGPSLDSRFDLNLLSKTPSKLPISQIQPNVKTVPTGEVVVVEGTIKSFQEGHPKVYFLVKDTLEKAIIDVKKLVATGDLPKGYLENFDKIFSLKIVLADLSHGGAEYNSFENVLNISPELLKEYEAGDISKESFIFYIKHEMQHLLSGQSSNTKVRQVGGESSISVINKVGLRRGTVVATQSRDTATDKIVVEKKVKKSGVWANEAAAELLAFILHGNPEFSDFAYPRELTKLTWLLADVGESLGIDKEIFHNAITEDWELTGENKTNPSKTWYRRFIDEVNRVTYERETGKIIKPKNTGKGWEMSSKEKLLVGGNFGWLKISREFGEDEDKQDAETQIKNKIVLDEVPDTKDLAKIKKDLAKILHPDTHSKDDTLDVNYKKTETFKFVSAAFDKILQVPMGIMADGIHELYNPSIRESLRFVSTDPVACLEIAANFILHNIVPETSQNLKKLILPVPEGEREKEMQKLSKKQFSFLSVPIQRSVGYSYKSLRPWASFMVDETFNVEYHKKRNDFTRFVESAKPNFTGIKINDLSKQDQVKVFDAFQDVRFNFADVPENYEYTNVMKYLKVDISFNETGDLLVYFEPKPRKVTRLHRVMGYLTRQGVEAPDPKTEKSISAFKSSLIGFMNRLDRGISRAILWEAEILKNEHKTRLVLLDNISEEESLLVKIRIAEFIAQLGDKKSLSDKMVIEVQRQKDEFGNIIGGGVELQFKLFANYDQYSEPSFQYTENLGDYFGF